MLYGTLLTSKAQLTYERHSGKNYISANKISNLILHSSQYGHSAHCASENRGNNILSRVVYSEHMFKMLQRPTAKRRVSGPQKKDLWDEQTNEGTGLVAQILLQANFYLSVCVWPEGPSAPLTRVKYVNQGGPFCVQGRQKEFVVRKDNGKIMVVRGRFVLCSSRSCFDFF